jgi:hypothetical protein
MSSETERLIKLRQRIYELEDDLAVARRDAQALRDLLKRMIEHNKKDPEAYGLELWCATADALYDEAIDAALAADDAQRRKKGRE